MINAKINDKDCNEHNRSDESLLSQIRKLQNAR